MTKTVLTFGDSNTHGTPPMHERGPYHRFGPQTRWPTVMQAALGDPWALIEEGLPGRTTCHADPTMGAHMDGQVGLRIAFESHGPVDLLVLMLGTNDLKTHFGSEPSQVVAGIAGLLGIATSELYQMRHGGFEILLVCPPPILEQGPISDGFLGANTKSRALPPLYAAMADHWNIAFLNAGDHIGPSETDGVHFEAASHVTLGHAVAAKIGSM